MDRNRSVLQLPLAKTRELSELAIASYFRPARAGKWKATLESDYH